MIAYRRTRSDNEFGSAGQPPPSGPGYPGVHTGVPAPPGLHVIETMRGLSLRRPLGQHAALAVMRRTAPAAPFRTLQIWEIPVTTRPAARLAMLAAALIPALAVPPAFADAADNAIVQALENSQRDKKGVTIYVDSHTLSGGVIRLEGQEWVELRNQQWGRIVVRISRISAVASQ